MTLLRFQVAFHCLRARFSKGSQICIKVLDFGPMAFFLRRADCISMIGLKKNAVGARTQETEAPRLQQEGPFNLIGFIYVIFAQLSPQSSSLG